MARIYRRKRTLQPIAELNVTNMIDLGFTLLIIFMITTQISQQEQTIPVNLPAESARMQQKPPPGTEFQAISIDRAGNYSFGTERVRWTELMSKLSALANKAKPPVIRIRADTTRQWGEVAKLMGELQRRNLTKITFDTQAGN